MWAFVGLFLSSGGVFKKQDEMFNTNECYSNRTLHTFSVIEFVTKVNLITGVTEDQEDKSHGINKDTARHLNPRREKVGPVVKTTPSTKGTCFPPSSTFLYTI